MPSRVFGGIRSSIVTLMSPQRRKNNPSLVGDANPNTAIPVTSPRNGMDSKRSRTSPPVNAAITNGMEWGRCHLEEFAQFSVGDQFVIIIPADHKNDSKNSITQRKAIRDRIIESVATVLADDSAPNVYRAPHRTLTNAARKTEAHQHLLRHHGIERNNKKNYIELRCCLHRYPHRDDFNNNIMPQKEIELLLRQNEGVYVSLLDFNEHVVNMRWKDLPFIQIWLPYSRSDHRPTISIQSERKSKKYLPELMSLYNAYKDDGNRMCEVLLAHHEKKNEYLLAQLRDSRDENTQLLRQSEHVVDVYNANVLQDEMTDHRLPQFVRNVDKMYYDAWVDHYSPFHPNTPLVLNTQMIDIYKTIESTFPCHFRSLVSIMFGKRSNEPKRANTKYNLDKRHVLVHYFFCLLRERDRHHLIHWALVATVALHYRGADNSFFRNHLGRASTMDVRVAFEKLEGIFVETAPNRMEVISSQQFVTNVLDNYNRFQSFSTQRCATSGNFHNGIVYSAIRVHEFNKPVGTLMANSLNQIWKVLSSTLSETFEQCTVLAVLLEKKEKDDNDYTETGCTRTVIFPDKEWKIVHIPLPHSEAEAAVPITYKEQSIPCSIRMTVPSDISQQDLIMNDRSWMATIHHSTKERRPLGVRELVFLSRKSRVLVDILTYVQDSIAADSSNVSNNRADINIQKCLLFRTRIRDCVDGDHPQMNRHIRQQQKHFLEYVNESYHAVSKYMWMTLSPNDEMNKDELFLAVIEMLSHLGFVDDTRGHGHVTVLDGFESRRIFQYGDVLTIQKLYQLNSGVLKMMTHIGQDASVRRLYSLLTETTLRSHDFLHENIHRLQSLYRVYYDGFISVCCSVISAKRVTRDPTKGTWRDHELIIIKMVSALKRLRFEIFLSVYDYESNEESVPNWLWQLGGEYQSFCASLCQSKNENTRYVALFMDFVDRWDRCRDAVKIGDWATLEVEAIDWLPVWAALKKPLYLVETMRRMETMYGMTTDELEHYRMNRFFRMHANGNFMSYDDFCEKHNYALKQCSNHPDIEVMCKKSKHLHAASRCAKLLFGYEGKTASSTPGTGDDVNALHQFFLSCNVFMDNNLECGLDTRFFERNMSVASFANSTEKQKITRQCRPQFTDAETIIIRSMTATHKEGADNEDDLEFGDGADEGEDDDHSIASTSTNEGGSIKGKEKTIKQQPELLKLGCQDLFSCDRDTFCNAVRNRITKLKEEDEMYSTISGSVKFFNDKMKKNMEMLKKRGKDRALRIARDELPHETQARCSRLGSITD